MEFDRKFFSSINYQTLLNISEQAADQLSIENHEYRSFCIDRFDKRLALLVKHFAEQKGTGIPEAEHSGWEHVCKEITLIQQQHGGVILALFHFGLHRSILVDLACNGIPVVSPIAGKAYWDFYQQKHIAPAEFANCFNLIEVNNPSVGKQLVKQMRKGQIVTIYVDGNMGPDGVHVSEGGVEVCFFGKKIHVKEGISRLASTFKMPVLPLFSLAKPNSENCYQIIAGEVLPTNSDVMQGLYSQLEGHITQRPQEWEYITCCHRWMQQHIGTFSSDMYESYKNTGLQLNRQNARLVEQGDDVLLFNLQRQTAVKLPTWSGELKHLLSNGCTANDVQQWLELDDENQLKVRLINELISKELVTALM
ncbi:hypothetical protein HRH59_17965 [Rheinheimera sp. YQF-2]|uniref:Lauroyl acyltransferase n=1 Tax=Rheinheimera lutimaris TaxID=2740584 RepID=A0A7Y5EMN5_9GAMM|nr:hypothetical protein [Rheinheimera lutimaris]NRQ44428.1 hypothetical protein [Rheinheimera lutimaris]